MQLTFQEKGKYFRQILPTGHSHIWCGFWFPLCCQFDSCSTKSTEATLWNDAVWIDGCFCVLLQKWRRSSQVLCLRGPLMQHWLLAFVTLMTANADLSAIWAKFQLFFPNKNLDQERITIDHLWLCSDGVQALRVARPGTENNLHFLEASSNRVKKMSFLQLLLEENLVSTAREIFYCFSEELLSAHRDKIKSSYMTPLQHRIA